MKLPHQHYSHAYPSPNSHEIPPTNISCFSFHTYHMHTNVQSNEIIAYYITALSFQFHSGIHTKHGHILWEKKLINTYGVTSANTTALATNSRPNWRSSPRRNGFFRSGDPFSPRQERDSGHCKVLAGSRSGDSVSPKRDYASLKNKNQSLRRQHELESRVSPCYSRLGEVTRLGEISRLCTCCAPVDTCTTISTKHTHGFKID